MLHLSVKIPLSRPLLGRPERKKLVKALKSGWLTQAGPDVKAMELNLATQYIRDNQDNLFVTTTSNGTTALHLALLALDIGPQCEVIVTNFAYVATINSILYCGATPVVVDIDPITWNIDLDELQNAITEKTSAILVVDNYGTVADYEKIRSAVPKNIKIIQDAAESFPGKDMEMSDLIQGDVAVCSFYANKVLTAGEGGAIFGSKDVISRVSFLKNQAQNPNENFVHSDVGYNYRISNLHAAVFNAQWDKREKIQKKRKKIFENYDSELKKSRIKYSTNRDRTSSFWLFTIKLEYPNLKISAIRAALEANGIESRPGFTPFSKLKYLEQKAKFKSDYPISDSIYRNIISLPTYPGLKKNHIRRIVKILELAIEENL